MTAGHIRPPSIDSKMHTDLAGYPPRSCDVASLKVHDDDICRLEHTLTSFPVGVTSKRLRSSRLERLPEVPRREAELVKPPGEMHPSRSLAVLHCSACPSFPRVPVKIRTVGLTNKLVTNEVFESNQLFEHEQIFVCYLSKLSVILRKIVHCGLAGPDSTHRQKLLALSDLVSKCVPECKNQLSYLQLTCRHSGR